MTERTGSATPPLTGRQFEREQLDAFFDRAAGGEAQTILIGGSAGVGKTTLVAATTSGRAGSVAVGTCLPMVSVTMPFMAIRAAMASVPTNGPRLPDVDTSLAGDESAVPGRFDGWLDRLCADGPAILVVEDLHWADQFTLDTLMYVIAGPASRRLAVVLTVRDDELSDGHRLQRWLADTRRLPRFAEMTVEPFDRLETAEQLAALLGEVPHQALVEDVFRRSGGNPLLTRLLSAGLEPHARRVADTIPSNLRSAVLHSWFTLPQRTREVVTILAVGSRPMRPAELAVVASEDASALREHLWTAVDAGVLESGRDGTFWFRHPLNAEVLEEAVPSDVRGRWHAAFADLLESDLETAGGARVSAVAEHRYRAGDLTAAYGWALRAASWHEVEGAHAEGVRMLRRALALREQVNATESVGDLLALIRAAAAKGGLYEEELRAVDEILASTTPEAEPGKVAELLVRRTHLHFSTGRAFFEQEGLREAVRLSASQPMSREHALALAVLAEAETWHGNPAGVEHARGALAIAREADDDRALAFALSANAVAALSLGDAAAGLRFAGEALDAGLRARDWWACAGATFWMANCSGTWSSADHTRAMSSGRERLAEAGAPHAYLAWIASAEAGCWLAMGAWQECAARLRETLATDPGVLADVSSRLAAARLAAWQGRQREAEQHLARADELFAQRSGFLAFCFDVVRAEVRLGAPDPEGAYLAAMAGINVPDSLPDMCEWLLPLAARALADRAQAARDAGQAPGVVLALADQLQESHPVTLRDFGYAAFPTYERQCRALDELYAAELSRTRAEACEGELWATAADSLGSMSMAWEEAYACRRGAEALLNRGHDRAAGAALLRKGLNLAEALAAAPLVGELRALALRARVPIRTAVATRGVMTAAADAAIRLTPREREILALLVSGRTYGEIATQLVISEKTVSSHVSNLLAKTGTANRVELAGYADRSGLTTG